MSWKPSLLAQPGHSVPWKSTVTLQCGSEVRADIFHLHREGSLDPPQQLHLQDTAAPSQANFTISPVTWSHSGTYRCYSSHSSSPFLLSQPSDPLELLVSGEEPQPCPCILRVSSDLVRQGNFKLDTGWGISKGEPALTSQRDAKATPPLPHPYPHPWGPDRFRGPREAA